MNLEVDNSLSPSLTLDLSYGEFCQWSVPLDLVAQCLRQNGVEVTEAGGGSGGEGGEGGGHTLSHTPSHALLVGVTLYQ